MRTALEERTPAGFWPRAAALLLDRAVLALALLTVRVPALIQALSGGGGLLRQALFTFTLRDILCWALCAAYFTALTFFTGGTLGKKALGLRVIRADGSRPGFWNILYRETIGRYLSGILCIGYIMVAADPEKRALHDMICDTRVVYAVPVAARAKMAPERTLTVLPTDDPQRDWYKPYRV